MKNVVRLKNATVAISYKGELLKVCRQESFKTKKQLACSRQSGFGTIKTKTKDRHGNVKH